MWLIGPFKSGIKLDGKNGLRSGSELGLHTLLCWVESFGIAMILIEFWLYVKAATLIFISGRGSAISSAEEGDSGFVYNLVKSL